MSEITAAFNYGMESIFLKATYWPGLVQLVAETQADNDKFKQLPPRENFYKIYVDDGSP